MSHIASAWAFEQYLPCQQKMVLVALADIHDKATNLCQPAIADLEKTCGLSRSAVKRAIKELEKKSLIKPLKRHRENGLQLANQYVLNVHGSDTLFPEEEKQESPKKESPKEMSVNRIMAAHGFSDQQIRKELLTIIQKELDQGESLEKIEKQLIQVWKLYQEQQALLRYICGPLTFLRRGYWKPENTWPYDQKKLDLYKESRVGRYM